MTGLVAALLKQFGPTAGGGTPPAAPTLAIADNGNGTGGVATISGGDVSATNTIYSQNVNGELGTNTWTARGSRTGSGTVALSPAPAVGYYWWKCESVTAGGSTTSNLAYQNISDGTKAVFQRCLEAVQARIQGLSLSGIAGSSVLIRKLPWAREAALPAILISPEEEEQSPEAGTVARDDVEYRARVTLLRKSSGNLKDDLDLILKWREKISRAFRQQRLPGVAEIYRCWVEPREIAGEEAFAAHLDAQALVIRCVSREGRGI